MIRHLTKKQTVAEVLRTEILNGTLAPGAQLQQEEIAERLGVSSTPVREAFGLLEAEGFVENRPHRGVVVAQHDQDEIGDVYELRTVVEEYAIRRVARNAGPATTDALERAIAETEIAMGKRDLARARRANTEFHLALMTGTGSAALVDVLNRLVARTLFFIPLDLRRFREIHDEHKQLLAAIRSRDEERAARVLTLELRRNFAAQRAVRRAGTSEAKPRRAVAKRRSGRSPLPAPAASRG